MAFMEFYVSIFLKTFKAESCLNGKILVFDTIRLRPNNYYSHRRSIGIVHYTRMYIIFGNFLVMSVTVSHRLCLLYLCLVMKNIEKPFSSESLSFSV